ncbi:APC family permease [Sulfuracidifex metallicus]|uniref:Amino acid permease n=1 Tax=Sulfuracidifex metallicus DSM 6482 = JCM 9184 TaxID=523847 RepID=A0A6A9QIV3_SULME|nr:APC family permease [Sulfuracidifex metallicus]MUN28906.1 amino acid permease [Sulfuracidifex metallicus DSM 6482 = JCM 9184]WOE50584.1 APC family permease [Sulfuracidifex metallicus DSM 6482 = JCM 9184]
MSNSISMIEATAVGLGAIIGAGIFVLSGAAISLAGSYSIIAFLFIGFLSVLIAMSLGELTTMFPHEKGSTYSYVFKAFGHELGLLTGIMVYFSFSTSIAAIAEGFGSYLSSTLGDPALTLIFASMLIAVLTGVNLIGIQKAAQADLVLVMIKLSILSLFIAFAIVYASSHFSLSHFQSTQSQSSILPFFSSSIAIFFAYTGFQVITSFADDVKGGPKNAAKAVVLSVLISMIFYVMVALSMIFLVPVKEFNVNADPLSFALAYSHAPAWIHIAVDVGGMIATTSATLAMILASGRTLYQISVDMKLPKFLSKYNEKKDVAPVATLISSTIAFITFFAGNVYVIASISNFGLMFSFIMSNLALLHFRRKGMSGSYRMPMFPFTIAASTLMLISLILGFPREALTINIIIIILVLLVSYILKDMREKEIVRQIKP